MTHPISATTLDDLVPVHELVRDERIRLARSGQVFDIEAGKKLTAIQEYPWIDYLLSGQVCLVSGDRKEMIESGTLRACQPLFSESRLREHAVFVAPGELLRLDRQLYENICGIHPPSLNSLGDLELNDTEGILLGKLYQACKKGNLSLPTLPKVAKAIQEAMRDPNITSAKLARIVQMDMAVTGGLIRVANSVMYRAAQPIPDVRNAIIRLGMEVTRSAVVSMAMQQLFRSKNPLMKHRMKAAWNRSVHVSALSYVLARHCEGFSPEQAMLAGLIHDVGVIPILDFVSRNQIEVDEDELEAAILKLHIMVGELVVDYWGLGPEIAQVVRESGNWHRDEKDAPDYCDIVLLARLYRLNQSETRGPLPRYDEVPAYYKLGLGYPEAEGEQVDVVAEASEELSAVMAMLRGDRV
ncbi:HDOD domain-containing protein [Thiorhodococcus mannitoliphagus]|uniref:HDOD domain-containing protein n=1 Tax=Thiorhodococcus mannitoliphagus TaxID=329406 RepID=A0A6P1DVF5_9GAMM|nr:HDOD domain-containing protein [Thiorhodococcus mannitoliphagus]NEX19645.1 HDOD domain-containing protein [Thiorhodococcus mannitoliphagus]